MKDLSFARSMWSTGQKYYHNNIVSRGNCKSRNRRVVSGYKRTRSQYNAIMQKCHNSSSIQRLGGVNNRVLISLEKRFYNITAHSERIEFINSLTKGSIRRFFLAKPVFNEN